ncbi:hypothetical protein [Riemerella columbina]|uniref:hypothetical protein n=1 Tax=Riemerella columbina TaxID=103810 RepID=UPI000362AC69|nr:hypothetical protein [Riemerella columbina]
MTQEEFNKLAEIETKGLNGSTTEESQECWKAGYLYACKIIYDKINTLYNEDFVDEMEKLANQSVELEVFDL